ncbi:hypothetical protein GGI13_002189 [Coemansia sp. RSA 455]|nr:hypothetical protein GGI13_002189 [Coemansia sp. RSA 455]
MNPLHAALGAESVGDLNKLYTSRPFYTAKNAQRKEEIEQRVRELLRDNYPDVWNHSHPPIAFRRIAEDLVDAISEALEGHLAHQGGAGDDIQLARAQQFNGWLAYAAAGNIEEPRRYSQIQAFFLYCAHEIQARLQGIPHEKCRLILPFQRYNFELPGCDDHTHPDIALCMRDFNTNVDLQQDPHYMDTGFIVEVKRYQNMFGEGVRQMGTYMLHMLRNQLDRRYAIGVTLCGTIAKVVVYGHDAVWASTGADLNTDAGRRVFIRQVVDWSLCTTDRIGLDSTIHRGPILPPLPPAAAQPPAQPAAAAVQPPAQPAAAAQPPAQPAAGQPPPQPRRVYEIVIDRKSYYSEECRQVADKLTGQRWWCIPVSDNRNAVGVPLHLLIDYWPLENHDEAVAISHVNMKLRNTPGVQGSYPTVHKKERVKQQREGAPAVYDDTDTAYGDLSRIPRNAVAGDIPVRDTHFRRHKRVLIKYPGEAISQAQNGWSVIVAITHAMAVHNSLVTLRPVARRPVAIPPVAIQILHGDINNNNIVHRMVGDALQGMLIGYDYAIDLRTGRQRQDQPEAAAIQALQSIRSLEDPKAVRTLLDVLESLLYLVCWLGTFGVNQAQRVAYVAGLPKDPDLPILAWNRGIAANIAEAKRFHMSTPVDFFGSIVSKMRENSPLRPLAEDIHMALFAHRDCYGTKVIEAMISNRALMMTDIPEALRNAMAEGRTRDVLVLRNDYMAAIIADLLEVLARHRDAALAALGAAPANIAGGA